MGHFTHISWSAIAKFVYYLIFSRFWRDWWYWNTAEERLLAFVKKTATEGDLASVFKAMEKFNEEYEWTLILDYDKRSKVEEVVRESAPKLAFEMGCYCGYSAMAIGSQLPSGSRLITAEIDPKIADVARQIIHFAGLDQVIAVATGKAEDVIRVLRSQYSMDKLDFVFIDHLKDQYFPDLKLLEECRLLRTGSILMADNAVWPGAPDFLKYIETCDRYKTDRFYYMVPFFNEQDALTLSVYTDHD